MTLTPALGALGVMSGSDLLALFGAVSIVVLCVRSGRLLERNRSPRFVVLVHGFTFALVIFAIVIFPRARIDAVLIVVMLGILNRFLLRGGHRDEFLVVGASTVLLAAATTITPGIAFLLIVLLFIASSLWALWTSMMLGAVAGSTPAQLDAMAVRSLPPESGRIAFSAIALTIVAFGTVSLLPRYRFAERFSVGHFAAFPGASDTMNLDTSGAPEKSDREVVLRVEPPPGAPPSAVDGLYARLFVLDEFDGRRFFEDARGFYPFHASGPRVSAEEDARAELRVTLSRLRKNPNHHPIATLGREYPSETSPPIQHHDGSGAIRALHFQGRTLTYGVRLDRPLRMPYLPRFLRESHEGKLLHVPDSLDPRVLALGKELTDGLLTTDDKVKAVLAHLAKGFAYSLEPLEGTAEDPLVRFLFEAKRGHCELYAAALAILLRIGGVPTRVVTGYYNGLWNDTGHYQAFTQGDAHAWVEVWDGREGWRFADATPVDMRIRRRPSTLAWFRDVIDAVEGIWYENVVDFGDSQRRQILARVAGNFEDLGRTLEGSIFGDASREGEDATSRSPRSRVRLALALFSMFFAVAIFCAAWAVLSRRIRRARRSGEALGRRLRSVLGETRGQNVTLGTLVARVPAAAEEPARRAVALYEALRFGAEGQPGASEVSVLEVDRAIGALKRALDEDARNAGVNSASTLLHAREAFEGGSGRDA